MLRADRFVKAVVGKLGVTISRAREMPADFDTETVDILRQVRAETMTSPERIAALVQAVRYVDRYGIPGAVVECGVWRGGSSMAAALAHSPRKRELYLYDTFEGMSEPTERDVEVSGRTASHALASEPKTSRTWAVAGLEVVRDNMARTGYPTDLIHYVAGKVEETIPGILPGSIAVLRLDTDWYESTRHELEHLIPLVAPGGVLIIDDYGHWVGARKAVDEWMGAYGNPVLLNRVDYTGRIAVLR
jgi:predicted O-methyltransferase YrrM